MDDPGDRQRAGGTTSETHPAAEWLTVMAYRITDLVPSAADDFAQAVLEGLTTRLNAWPGHDERSPHLAPSLYRVTERRRPGT